MSIHDYSVFGLKVRSELELPELFKAEADGAPDVRISVGPAGGPADGTPGLYADGDGLILIVNEAARFRVSGGNSIVVEPEPGVPERNVRLFLLGSAFGALLHQRGLLPLHANAVEIDGKAVAFMGESGAGKSTLAAWFHDAGYRVLADDVCVVRFDERQCPRVAPGLPRLRLWLEALEISGRDSVGLDRSYIGAAAEMDKFDVPIAATAAAEPSVQIAAVYLLERAANFSIESLNGVEAAEAIFAHTYRGAFIDAAKRQESHWQSAIRLVQGCPIYRARRRWDLTDVAPQAERFLTHIRDLARNDCS